MKTLTITAADCTCDNLGRYHHAPIICKKPTHVQFLGMREIVIDAPTGGIAIYTSGGDLYIDGGNLDTGGGALFTRGGGPATFGGDIDTDGGRINGYPVAARTVQLRRLRAVRRQIEFHPARKPVKQQGE